MPVVWRKKQKLETVSNWNDLYKNLKCNEPEVKGMSSSRSSNIKHGIECLSQIRTLEALMKQLMLLIELKLLALKKEATVNGNEDNWFLIIQSRVLQLPQEGDIFARECRHQEIKQQEQGSSRMCALETSTSNRFGVM
ncbi:hypothetical protein Tco_0268298 [Tanacetum coccineum]